MPVGRRFQPGTSGNPHGRPRADYDIARMCREHAPEAVERILAVMRDPDPKVALPACVYLLNRGFGLPSTKIEATDTQSLAFLHLVAARELGARIRDERSEATIDGTVSQETQRDQPIDLTQPALE
jgi:hypothetical protein